MFELPDLGKMLAGLFVVAVLVGMVIASILFLIF